LVIDSVIDPAERAMLNRDVGFAYGTAYASTTVLIANTPQNILAAASNVNGVILWACGLNGIHATGSTASFLAKATAPGTVIDGDVLGIAFLAASTNQPMPNLGQSRFVSSGKRLDAISTLTLASNLFHALFTAL